MLFNKKHRTKIEDLIVEENDLLDLSEDQIRAVSGGLYICESYGGASSTFCNDTDYRRVD